MNTLLLFFALPVATIILAIVVEKILKCPILTAATFFAIYLIVAFAVFDASFLIFVIVYTIIAFITALVAEYIFIRRCDKENNCCRWNCLSRREINNNTITLTNQDVRRIAEEVTNIQNNNNCKPNNTRNCNYSNDIATVNVTNNTTGGRTSWCCYRR